MRPCWLQHFHLFVATSEYHDFYFQRSADHEPTELRIHMPQRILATTVNHYPIDVLVSHWEKYLVDPSSSEIGFRGLRDLSWACPYQRGPVDWSGT